MKEQQIYKDINELFKSIIQKKQTGEIEQFFKFQKNNPQHAPFNNALVYTQNPECVYYMTAKQWGVKNRTIIEGSRPLVILFPFGPVQFVYDLKNTQGEDNLDLNTCIHWWKEKKSNILTEEIFNKTVKHFEKKYQIPLISKQPKEYFEKHSLSTGGYARGDKNSNKLEITLHPRYSALNDNNIDEAYGILVHEIAHIFLGHLGQKDYEVKNKEGKITTKQLCKDRPGLTKPVIELEAELTAWLVFNRFGIEKQSVEYLAGWLTRTEDWDKIDMALVLRIANVIFEMKN